MQLAKKLAGVAPFAHLLGLAKTRAEGEDKREDAEEEEEKKSKKSKRAEEDAEDEKDDESAEDEEAEDGEDDEEDKDDKKSKKAKNDDKDGDGDEEEDDDKDNAKKAYRRGVKAERARCGAIFKCSAAGSRPDVAAHLAFETGMSAKNAIAMLNTVAAGGTQKRGLAERMAALKTPNPGADGGAPADPSSPKSVADQMIAAAKKARGEA